MSNLQGVACHHLLLVGLASHIYRSTGSGVGSVPLGSSARCGSCHSHGHTGPGWPGLKKPLCLVSLLPQVSGLSTNPLYWNCHLTTVIVNQANDERIGLTGAI